MQANRARLSVYPQYVPPSFFLSPAGMLTTLVLVAGCLKESSFDDYHLQRSGVIGKVSRRAFLRRVFSSPLTNSTCLKSKRRYSKVFSMVSVTPNFYYSNKRNLTRTSSYLALKT